MQVKTASRETTVKFQLLLTNDALTIPPKTTELITAFVDHPSEWNTTGTLALLEESTETASLLISQWTSTNFDKRVAVGVTNTTESPDLIQKNTQSAEFSVVTPEQSKYVKSVDLQSSAWSDKVILTWLPTYTNVSEQIKPSSKTTLSGSQHLKILEHPKITPQYRHDS